MDLLKREKAIAEAFDKIAAPPAYLSESSYAALKYYSEALGKLYDSAYNTALNVQEGNKIINDVKPNENETNT